jgi:hypothetical protein
MRGLTEFRNTTIVADKKFPSCLFIVLATGAFKQTPAADTVVVMSENARYIQSVFARHTVFAGCTLNVISVRKDFHYLPEY